MWSLKSPHGICILLSRPLVTTLNYCFLLSGPSISIEVLRIFKEELHSKTHYQDGSLCFGI